VEKDCNSLYILDYWMCIFKLQFLVNIDITMHVPLIHCGMEEQWEILRRSQDFQTNYFGNVDVDWFAQLFSTNCTWVSGISFGFIMGSKARSNGLFFRWTRWTLAKSNVFVFPICGLYGCVVNITEILFSGGWRLCCFWWRWRKGSISIVILFSHLFLVPSNSFAITSYDLDVSLYLKIRKT